MNEIELGTEAVCILVGVGLLSGFASLWVFRRWSDTAKLRASFNRIIAHLFELRLFSDEPALVLRAQRDLIAANGRFLWQMSVPSLLLILPFGLLLLGMDGIFALAPLPPGRPAVVTLQYPSSVGGAITKAQLQTPTGVQIETPPVHVPRLSQISWRIRPVRAVKGELQVRYGGRVITKAVSSSPGLQWLANPRTGPISISVEYPRATVFNHGWIFWFSLAFIAGGLAGLVSKRFAP